MLPRREATRKVADVRAWFEERIIGQVEAIETVVEMVALFKAGLKHVTAGANPIYLKRGIDKAVEAAVAELAKIAKKVNDSEEIRQVATVSANWDNEIGKIIAAALEKVGKDGTVTVEEAECLGREADLVAIPDNIDAPDWKETWDASFSRIFPKCGLSVPDRREP